jgi:hypothetical protein
VDSFEFLKFLEGRKEGVNANIKNQNEAKKSIAGSLYYE